MLWPNYENTGTMLHIMSLIIPTLAYDETWIRRIRIMPAACSWHAVQHVGLQRSRRSTSMWTSEPNVVSVITHGPVAVSVSWAGCCGIFKYSILCLRILFSLADYSWGFILLEDFLTCTSPLINDSPITYLFSDLALS